VSTPVTRCPHCGTAFRATQAQLMARGGMVRCGKCAAVFDGVAHLVEESASGEPLEPSPQLGLFDPGAAAAMAAKAAQRPGPRPAAAAQDDDPLPEFLEEEQPRARYTLVWGLAALLALAALLGQLAYHYRTELAVLLPQTRPFLAEGCRLLDCELRLPRRPDLLSIESSDLQADNRREGLIVLNAVIRNRAPFAQEYPSLELTLTDAADKALVRRVLRPADYLAVAVREHLAQGIGPGSEAVLRVHFDTGDVRATGYRLYLFYPS
jgi:predicted Zn finger-like uncharacterized protein